MAFRIHPRDDTVEAAVRRIAREQIEGALASIVGKPRDAAIHDVRKRCKKLRSLVRLVRPVFAGYKEENAFFRDTARLISGARDAAVMLQTLDALSRDCGDRTKQRALLAVRRALVPQDGSDSTPPEAGDALATVAERLEQARGRVEEWRLDEEGWDALCKGLAASYRRARRAAWAAREHPDAERFHELRKQIKHHWYQCRLLEPVWPQVMAARIETARQLSELLGDHHDLDVLADRLAADPARYGTLRNIEIAQQIIGERRAALEIAAWPMTGRLLAQSVDALVAEFAVLWTIWRHECDRAASARAD